MSACDKTRSYIHQESGQTHPKAEESNGKKKNLVPQRQRTLFAVLIPAADKALKWIHATEYRALRAN